MLSAERIATLLVLFASVVVHEYAHAWTAYRLGDPTAKMYGRMTLNPVKHVDLVGTILVPVFLIMVRSPYLFGWAKPVPVNFWQLRNPKRDMMWVGIAGPVVNVVLAVALSLALNFVSAGIAVYRLLAYAVLINLVLAVFNMMPIPPLDGSRLVFGLLPRRWAYRYGQLERYGFVLVILFISMGIFERFVLPVVIISGALLGVDFRYL